MQFFPLFVCLSSFKRGVGGKGFGTLQVRREVGIPGSLGLSMIERLR